MTAAAIIATITGADEARTFENPLCPLALPKGGQNG